MNRQTKLLIWEIACIFWVALAGSLLHFAFELSEYWQPMALIAAVNESIWEHTKMYFWPGLLFALAQYTYTRDYANNFWLGKVVALAVTPIVILCCYEGYIFYAAAMDTKPSLALMLGIMVLGISTGQLASWRILSADPISSATRRFAPVGYALLITLFSTLTYFPPKIFIFENFACYTYTGEYGILTDYEPYRIFTSLDENGVQQDGIGVNYCAQIKSDQLARMSAVKQ